MKEENIILSIIIGLMGSHGSDSLLGMTRSCMQMRWAGLYLSTYLLVITTATPAITHPLQKIEKIDQLVDEIF